MTTKKKGAAQELTVEEKLVVLYNLQTNVSEIDRIRTVRGELPLEVQELEDEIEGRNTRKQKFEHEIANRKRYINERKQMILKSQELIDRYNEQLKTVRNNREYDALSKEVEYQNLEVQFSEKKIAEDQMAISQIEEDLHALEEDTAGRLEDLHTKQHELDEIVQETRDEEEKLRAQAKELEEKIEPRLLSAFKRLRKASRNGLAVATIDREACTGCFNKIPPQRQLDVKLRKKIIVCEYCGRILVDPEMANEIEGFKGKE